MRILNGPPRPQAPECSSSSGELNCRIWRRREHILSPHIKINEKQETLTTPHDRSCKRRTKGTPTAG